MVILQCTSLQVCQNTSVPPNLASHSEMTMKAVIFSGTKGDPGQVCSYKDVPKPTPGNGQVLIRVLYSPVHPSTVASVSPGTHIAVNGL